MLFWCKSIDFAAPVRELAGSNVLIDLKRNVVDHLAWLTRDCVAVLHKILCAERLDSE